jgi:hypothetical protein
LQTCSYHDAHSASVAGAELLVSLQRRRPLQSPLVQVKRLPTAHGQPCESAEFEAAAGAHRNGGGWQYDTRDSFRNTTRDSLNMLCVHLKSWIN